MLALIIGSTVLLFSGITAYVLRSIAPQPK
ncbi:hypothetical protein SAMN05518872_1084 [Psychrobacillus sp. OK032]|nr:hypothetical protein SAMN05518872_1084 [Psychrobacillus sp. OK032]